MSIGISVYPDDGKDAETLLKSADAALFHAKAKGGNTYQVFEPDMIARGRRSEPAGSLPDVRSALR